MKNKSKEFLLVGLLCLINHNTYAGPLIMMTSPTVSPMQRNQIYSVNKQIENKNIQSSFPTVDATNLMQSIELASKKENVHKKIDNLREKHMLSNNNNPINNRY